MITEVTPVNERIMKLKISHNLGIISLVSLYGPTGVSDFFMKEAFSMQLLALQDMAISHVLVLKTLDQEIKAPQCSLTL